ncbi:unnamed protein product [Prunus armeniaca]
MPSAHRHHEAYAMPSANLSNMSDAHREAFNATPGPSPNATLAERQGPCRTWRKLTAQPPPRKSAHPTREAPSLHFLLKQAQAAEGFDGSK